MDHLVHPDVEAYAEAHTTPEAPHLTALAEETRSGGLAAQMMVGHLEGGFLAALVAMLAPQRVLEIGTFTGYSSLAMAAALPPGATITTCDISERHVEVARRHIAASPYADRIAIRLGPAIDTIAGLDGPFDFVFIDADKTGYAAYYEAVLPKLSDRGVIAVDNVLWRGQVIEPGDSPSDDTTALIAFNDMVVADERVTCVLATVRDGVLLIRKRGA